jgi:hypothetical protein
MGGRLVTNKHIQWKSPPVTELCCYLHSAFCTYTHTYIVRQIGYRTRNSARFSSVPIKHTFSNRDPLNLLGVPQNIVTGSARNSGINIWLFGNTSKFYECISKYREKFIRQLEILEYSPCANNSLFVNFMECLPCIFIRLRITTSNRCTSIRLLDIQTLLHV